MAGEVRELRRRGIAVTVYAAQTESARRDLGRRRARCARWRWGCERRAAQCAARGSGGPEHDPRPSRAICATSAAGVERSTSSRLRRLAPAVERLSREGAQHIHVHFAAEASLAALRVSRLTGIPFSITAHAYELFQRPANLR